MPVNALEQGLPQGNALRGAVDPELLEIMRRERLRAAEHTAAQRRPVPPLGNQLRELLDVVALAPVGAGDVAELASLGLSLRAPEFRAALAEPPRFKSRAELLADAITAAAPDNTLIERLAGVPRLLQAMNPLLQTGLNEEQLRVAGALPLVPGTVGRARQARRAADEGVPRTTETKEFRRWFGDSKVVDSEGQPLVVYHGTRADFAEFQPDREGAIYFTDSPRDAAAFSGDFRGFPAELQTFEQGGANIMPVYLSMRNPLEVDFDFELFSPDRVERAIKRAKEAGHDGVIIRNIQNFEGGEASTTYIVFRPEQIKSAVGNRGTFGPDDPNITAAVRQKSDSQARSA